MSQLPVFRAGGYRYIKAVLQYSGGVAAEPGFEIWFLSVTRGSSAGQRDGERYGFFWGGKL